MAARSAYSASLPIMSAPFCLATLPPGFVGYNFPALIDHVTKPKKVSSAVPHLQLTAERADRNFNLGTTPPRFHVRAFLPTPSHVATFLFGGL